VLASPLLAVPNPTGVNGTLTHGESVTISGSGFGTKATAAPNLFDKCESYTGLSNGDAIPGAGSNPIYGGDTLSYYNTTSGEQRGTLSVANYHSHTDKNYVDGRMISGSPSFLYLSYWFRTNTSVPHEAAKYVRLSQYLDGDETYHTLDFAPMLSQVFHFDTCQLVDWTDYYPSTNTWHFIELWLDNTSHLYTVRTDGATLLALDYSTCPLTFDYLWKVGWDSGTGDQIVSFVDDIYYDGSQSRVMIGNASTYANCTASEMQPASSWSTSSIAVTLNQGSFADSSTAYVYVIDSDGAVNSSGHEITFGESGGDTTNPTVTISTTDPTNVSVSSVTVNWSDSDAVGVTSRKWRLGAAPDATHGTTTDGATSTVVTGLSSGANTVYIGAGDAAGNWGSDSITVNYTPPPETLTSSGGMSSSGGATSW